MLLLPPTRARTRRATWLQAALGLAIAVVLVVVDLVAGWTWWHVTFAVINAGFAVQFARGALEWQEPRRALDDTRKVR